MKGNSDQITIMLQILLFAYVLHYHLVCSVSVRLLSIRTKWNVQTIQFSQWFCSWLKQINQKSYFPKKPSSPNWGNHSSVVRNWQLWPYAGRACFFCKRHVKSISLGIKSIAFAEITNCEQNVVRTFYLFIDCDRHILLYFGAGGLVCLFMV